MMNTLPRISIPVPCHEDWNAMTVANDARFCANCAKNVIDFTSKSNDEIRKILIESKGQSICGRFRKEQVAAVRISIPQSVFFQRMPFHRAFLLVLFTTMGSMLFSCSDDEGQKQSIKAVEVVEMPYDDRFLSGMVMLPSDFKYHMEDAAPANPETDSPADWFESAQTADSTFTDTLDRCGHSDAINASPNDTLPEPPEFEIR